MILAIDPGNTQSAYVVLNDDLRPIDFDLISNEALLQKLQHDEFEWDISDMAIEMVASYGMAVGKEVFETVFWIGRFWEAYTIMTVLKPRFIYRKEEKMNLCGTMKAKDGNIIQALKDRFGDKGTKAEPGWFYGFKADIWQAYAVGVTYADLYIGKKVDNG